MKYAIGLDLGIKNIGWAIYNLDNSSIVNYGVRCFSVSNDAKDRRSFRAGRRLRKRKYNRIKDIKKILKKIDFPTSNTLDSKMIETRCNGLVNKISKQDITNILFYFCANRGYIPFDEEDDSKTKLEFAKLNGKYPCQYYKEMLNTIGKYHNMHKLVLNKDNLNELTKILQVQQQYYSILTDDVITNIIKVISRKREFWEGPGGGTNYVITPYGRFKNKEEVQDYIEKKGKNSFYEKYLFEDLIGNCEIAINEKKAPLLNFYAEKFNAINILLNLYFTADNLSNDYFKLEKDIYKLNRHAIESILNYALFNNESNLEKLIKKVLGVDIEIVKGYSDKNIFVHYIYIKKQLIKEQCDINWMDNIELYNKVIYYLTLTPGILEFTAFVKNNLSDEYDFNESFFKCFEEIRRKRKSFLVYHKLSEKILLKAIDDMLENEINFEKAKRMFCYDKDTLDYFRKNYTNQTRNLTLLDPKHVDNIIASPQVKKTLRQAIKIINAIIKEEKHYPEVIAIESTKDVNSKEQKKQIEKSQKIQKDLRDAAIKELGDINNETLIEKYMLFKEVNGVCPYCGKPLTKEIKSWDNIHIDHILPRSITFDNSFENKTACCYECNEKKKNRSPYDYLKNNESQYNEFIERINNLKISDEKRENFLNNNILDKYKIRFFNRNLRDTSYATTELVKQINLLNNYNNDENQKIKTFSTSGKVTSEVRKKYKLNKDRDTLFHHAVDASLLLSILNTEYGEIILKSQNDKSFWFHNQLNKLDGINDIIDKIDISKNIEEIKTISDDNIRKSIQVDKSALGSFADARVYKIIKKEDRFYKIEQIDIYNDLLFDDKSDKGAKDFEVLFDENDKTRVLLCQEKDYKLFKKLKDIYNQYKGIKGNPFINYLIEIGEFEEKGIAGVHFGIRQNNNKSAFVKTLRYYTPITDPYLINKSNINKKDKTYIGYNGLSQVCTQIFYDEEDKKYLFLPINKICVKNGRIDSNNEYYKMIYQKLVGNKKIKFIDSIYCGDCVDIVKKDGTIISDYYSNYDKTNKKLAFKNGNYFTSNDQGIIIYDVDILGNKKMRKKD